MIHRIEVRARDGFGNPHADGVHAQIRELGIAGVTGVTSARLYFLFGDLSAEDAQRVADELLVDRVSERALLDTSDGAGSAVIEVHLQPGVMDPVAASAERAIRDIGLPVEAVRTGCRYELAGQVTEDERRLIAQKLLANPVVDDVYYEAHTPEEIHAHEYVLDVVEVNICDLDDVGLQKLSEQGHLFLNLTEMQAIQNYFRDLGREPRDVELEMIAQTWSEHCVHKTFRSDVQVRDGQGNVIEEIPNLIKSTVFGSTKELDKPWCLNVFEDNAGVIEFDDEHAVCFKVETHNHPSAIEPYGGASTGIGGVVRDPMGTGLGARPVANTDVFCFGNPSMPLDDVPKGVLHPRRVMRGVVGGVRDYGNRMGIPTVNGAVYFDDRYLGNPLVFCGTLGLLPRDKCTKQRPGEGDAVVVVGGRTGRDGIHGATFSSGELTHEHETEFSHAVQIGNAITEKKMLDTILQARDAGLFSCITDCGAGGLSSAVGEMGEKIGAEVHLDRVPLKYAGLSYDEIWISEAQERMVLAVPQENVERILQVFADEDVEATVIGHYGTPDRKLRLFYQETLVGELDMKFVHDGLPRPTKEALWDRTPEPTPAPPAQGDYTDSLRKILALPNVASKEWIIRQYDHEVQGGSVVKPLVGVDGDGPGDAAVVRPVLGSQKAVVLSCGMNPRLGDLDAYQSALHAVDEALRNLVSVGGNLERTAILDNFCWGNCNKPDRMGTFVQAAKGCRDAALAYGTPFVSGKDSLNNEFRTDSGEVIAIPPTLLISAFGVIENAPACITADAKEPGSVLYQVGATRPELGGSHYLLAEGLPGGNDVPPVDLESNRRTMKALSRAIEARLVRSCHDLSEGGLAVAAAEMAFSGGVGMEIDMHNVPLVGDLTDGSGEDHAGVIGLVAKLFGESAGRFLVEVRQENVEAFEKAMDRLAIGRIGTVTDSDRLVIKTRESTVVDLPNAEAKAAWQGTFRW
ncbi:MAG: phosphoribosylformylglycinamidine synthase subunit PurL [Phycisphaerae bacterium]